ncbi:hypothetical protein V6N12_064332 [Hibiscus sabdariffa]|uniref:Uncharacterized protein n=1 Tax=Hibiscus sabdariffa TaxID=183260 RepID=A0ABR2G5S6_9ROSI
MAVAVAATMEIVGHVRRVKRNKAQRIGRCCAVKVDKFGRYSENGIFAFSHGFAALIPPFDYLSLAELELQRSAFVTAGIELGSVEQSSSVMHFDFIAILRCL